MSTNRKHFQNFIHLLNKNLVFLISWHQIDLGYTKSTCIRWWRWCILCFMFSDEISDGLIIYWRNCCFLLSHIFPNFLSSLSVHSFKRLFRWFFQGNSLWTAFCSVALRPKQGLEKNFFIEFYSDYMGRKLSWDSPLVG